MATRAHSTRTPLLRPSGSPQPLLGLGLGQQPGPVSNPPNLTDGQVTAAARQPHPLTGIDNLSDAQVQATKKQPGPVTQAIRAMRAADPFVTDPELRAIRDTAERMIADSRAARFRAIQSLRRANAVLRSARAVGGRA